jgi:hypothetical protein
MWYVAAGCLALAGIVSREGGLTLAGLLIFAGRRIQTRDNRTPSRPVDSLTQARRTLISLAVGLNLLGVMASSGVKNENCPIGALDYIGMMFLLFHWASCYSLWRNLGFEERKKIARVSLGMLAVVVVGEVAPSSCQRYSSSPFTSGLEWMMYTVDASVCIIALFRSREERALER